MEAVVAVGVRGEEAEDAALAGSSVVDSDHDGHVAGVVHVGLGHLKVGVDGEELGEEEGDESGVVGP